MVLLYRVLGGGVVWVAARRHSRAFGDWFVEGEVGIILVVRARAGEQS
ncbi:hypothetical protein [Hymenobacter terrenus]|nr:hypothetical protein [Hymenobacter terrenus]